MTSTPPTHRAPLSNALAGALGGLVVLVLGAALIATDVIDTGDTTRQVVERQSALARPAASGDAARTVSDIYRQEGRGVVFVQARGVSGDSPFGMPDLEGGTATGSGFVVDEDGTIITNAHVVEGSTDVSVRFDEDGEFVDAKVVGRDPSSDIAVLEVDPSQAKLEPVPLGRSADVEVGDPVVAIGNPFGFTRTVTTGIVSALQRRIEAPNGFPIRNVIQTDASINPGNSGGPLLDAEGRVIGINSQIATGAAGGSVGIGFAVPIDTVRSLLPRLKRDGRVERSYLGIEMAPVTGQVAEDLDLAVDEGALITRVLSGGPAAKAGLRGGRRPTGEGIVAGGDLIVKVGDTAVKTPDDVARAIADDEPGNAVEVVYYRGEEKRTVEVTLGKRPGTVQTDSSGGDGGPLP
ncbi:MAG: S1C family serine protease [Thermoleophilaceae bacterium]